MDWQACYWRGAAAYQVGRGDGSWQRLAWGDPPRCWMVRMLERGAAGRGGRQLAGNSRSVARGGRHLVSGSGAAAGGAASLGGAARLLAGAAGR